MKGYSKFHAIKTTVDGITFDSKKEAMVYSNLKLLAKAGKIKDLQLQVPFELIPKNENGRKVIYKADFTYIDCQTNELVVMDAKGFKTDVYKLKKRLMAEKGIKIKEV